MGIFSNGRSKRLQPMHMSQPPMVPQDGGYYQPQSPAPQGYSTQDQQQPNVVVRGIEKKPSGGPGQLADPGDPKKNMRNALNICDDNIRSLQRTYGGLKFDYRRAKAAGEVQNMNDIKRTMAILLAQVDQAKRMKTTTKTMQVKAGIQEAQASMMYALNAMYSATPDVLPLDLKDKQEEYAKRQDQFNDMMGNIMQSLEQEAEADPVIADEITRFEAQVERDLANTVNSPLQNVPPVAQKNEEEARKLSALLNG